MRADYNSIAARAGRPNGPTPSEPCLGSGGGGVQHLARCRQVTAKGLAAAGKVKQRERVEVLNGFTRSAALNRLNIYLIPLLRGEVALQAGVSPR